MDGSEINEHQGKLGALNCKERIQKYVYFVLVHFSSLFSGFGKTLVEFSTDRGRQMSSLLS
jgi:hypothetical protein